MCWQCVIYCPLLASIWSVNSCLLKTVGMPLEWKTKDHTIHSDSIIPAIPHGTFTPVELWCLDMIISLLDTPCDLQASSKMNSVIPRLLISVSSSPSCTITKRCLKHYLIMTVVKNVSCCHCYSLRAHRNPFIFHNTVTADPDVWKF